jgi:hypothetical protein
MVKYKGPGRPKQPASKETWQETIRDRIAMGGRVVPIISNSLTNDLAFDGHDDLVQNWAIHTGYPVSNQRHDLARMTQYESIAIAEGRRGDEVRVKERYLEFLKEVLFWIAEEDPHVSEERQLELKAQAPGLNVSELARRLNYPSLDSVHENPLLLLAALPLPLYLTTCYHDFLEVALKQKAKKKPRTEICRWQPEALSHVPSVFATEPDYDPSPDEPLVYHLHGLDRYPASLVLTEDDHLDFLTNILTAINERVMHRLNQSSLVVLGYSLGSWDFRVLFRGVLTARPRELWKSSVAIQLNDNDYERQYLERYLRQISFEVEWAAASEFIESLYQGWEAQKGGA